MDDALFVRDGDTYVPTPHTTSPWDRRSQHAGAPAALLGGAIERLGADVPMHVARFTLELLRPVPLAPLAVSAHVVRAGRRVQFCTASALAGGAEVCRAAAWRIRVADLHLPVFQVTAARIGAPQSAALFLESGEPALHRTGMEIRFSSGHFDIPGDAIAWFRLRVPVVAGEEPTPLQRTLAAADFGNGISGVFEHLSYLYINTELTVHLHRYPVGEWVCLDAHTAVESSGIGLASSALYDEAGSLGRAAESLLIDERPDASPSP